MLIHKPFTMADNDEIERKASNESNSSVISLFYEGDLMVGEKKSYESMSSSDGTNPSITDRFQALPEDKALYPSELMKILCDINLSGLNVECLNFVVRKILATNNDDISAFKPQLEEILEIGFKFDTLMVNQLMQYCTRKYNMNFYQFVLKAIINKLTKTEIDKLNADILGEFVNERLKHVSSQRLGLSRKTRYNDI